MTRHSLRTASWLALSVLASAQEEFVDDPFYYEAEKLGWDLCEARDTPGVAIARIRRGEIAWALGCGYADVEAQELVTPETVFNIGSISKTLATFGFMKLVEEGKVELDVPVERYLTRWKLPASEFDASGVTLRRLLSHTAGLSLHGYPGYDPGETLPTLEESLSGKSNAGELVLISAPGTSWKYSGGGFTIAQLMLEEVTERDFAEFMRVEVFEPLGMLSTDYRWTEEITARAATPYDQSEKAVGGPHFIALAAAGCQTSVLDLARFGVASLAADASSDGKGPVLAPKTLALMQSPAPASPEYGLGFSIEDHAGIRVVGHGGSNRGWMALLALAPALDDGLVVLTNGSNGGALHGPIRGAWIAHLKLEAEEGGE